MTKVTQHWQSAVQHSDSPVPQRRHQATRSEQFALDQEPPEFYKDRPTLILTAAKKKKSKANKTTEKKWESRWTNPHGSSKDHVWAYGSSKDPLQGNPFDEDQRKEFEKKVDE